MASLGSLVIELAANTARLQSDMGKAVGIVERGANGMKAAMGRFAGIAAGGLVAKIAADAIEFGDNLNKAAIKAGVSGKAISELAYVAKQSDVDLTSLSTALRKMQIALSEAGSGAKQPNQALAALGLTLSDIKGLSADRQFEVIGDRINQLKDPADRARAATELFGKAGADLLPLFENGAAGIRAAREEAQRLGLSFGDETLKRLADADDSIKRMKSSFGAFALTLTAEVAPALSKTLDNITAIVADDKIGKLQARIDFFQRMSKEEGYVGFSKEFGYGYQSAADAAERALEAQKELDRLTRPKVKPGGRERGGAAVGFGGASTAAEIDAISVTAKHIDKVKLLADTNEYLFAKYMEGVKNSIRMEEQWREATEVDLKSLVPTWEENTAEIQKLSDEALEATFKKLSEMTVYAEQAARNMQDALANFLFDPFKDGLKGMLRGFIDIIRKMVAEAAAAKIFGSSKSGGLGLGDAITTFASSLFGGFKASGGPLEQGKWYIAGERGPEPIWGGGAGAYAAGYGSGGGGVQNVFNIDARGAQEGVAVQIQRAIAQAAPMIVDASRRSVKDDLSRGAMR